MAALGSGGWHGRTGGITQAEWNRDSIYRHYVHFQAVSGFTVRLRARCHAHAELISNEGCQFYLNPSPVTTASMRVEMIYTQQGMDCVVELPRQSQMRVRGPKHPLSPSLRIWLGTAFSIVVATMQPAEQGNREMDTK